MKYIITEQQYEQLSEMIKLDIKVGDTILSGKFKNKKTIVKTCCNSSILCKVKKFKCDKKWFKSLTC